LKANSQLLSVATKARCVWLHDGW